MRRHEESSEQDYERALKLGEDNAKCISEMRRWCQHCRITQESGGLYAQMSGLPIGGHKIECPYAQGGLYSANLRWICSDFLVQNCAGCPHHAPNGDVTWGQAIITDHENAVRVRAEETNRRNNEIIRLRTSLREQSQAIRARAGDESHRLVEFLETMFSEDDEQRRGAVERLTQAARVGADLFPAEAVDLLLSLTLNDDFTTPALSICSELAGRRDDLTRKLGDTAVSCIQQGMRPHEAAAIIDRLGDKFSYPLGDNCVESLLLSQIHERPIGGWHDAEPDYTNSTAILARSVDAEAESVRRLIRRHLQNENDYVRAQLCGALGLLQARRPEFVLSILEDLMRSLELPEDDRTGHGTPSGMLVRLFQVAFRGSPRGVDAFLGTAMERVRPAVQEDIVRIYREQFFDRGLDWRERRSRKHTDDVSEAEITAIRRLIQWMNDDRLEPDIRHEVTESLELACKYATGEMVKEFDSLLGYFALLCEQEKAPAAPPRIILPGEKEDPALDQMKEASRQQHWGFFKQGIVGCLEELCKARPMDVFESVYGCLNQPTAPLGNAFRGAMVSLLGELGAEFQLQQRALPLMMRELMNYGSGWVRAKAIDATIEMFSSHKNPPPANVVDTMIVHLRDQMVVVHQAAVRVIDRRSDWFTESQAREALICLTGHINAYRTDPYQLGKVCEAALSLACRSDELKPLAMTIVEAVFPTGQEHVDARIAGEMRHFAKPSDAFAPRVARHLAKSLAIHGRDRNNSYNFSDRGRIFEWLHELPPEKFIVVAKDLLVHAKQLAANDYWESWHFASLFSQFGLYRCEREVLEAARDALPTEKRMEDLRETLHGVIAVASANACLQQGEQQRAEAFFATADGELR